MLCNFLVRKLQYCKKHPQKLRKKPQFHLFLYCPELSKRPKQKKSCSKLWLIDQLYMELEILFLWNKSKIMFIQLSKVPPNAAVQFDQSGEKD